jgi:hypothetical protein
LLDEHRRDQTWAASSCFGTVIWYFVSKRPPR